MFLSKLTLNIRNRGALKDISNAYSLHQTLINLFPDYDNSENSKYLFRLEIDEQKLTATILLQSTLEPDFDSKIETGYLMSAQSKEYKPIINNGDVFRFRLNANVVRRRLYSPEKDTNSWKKNKKSILVPLYDETEIENWLNSRATANGLNIVGIPEYAKYYQKAFKKDCAPITHFGVKFDGKLIINNADLAYNALINGIGKGKSFGFGLLSLKK
jgi:CRISPR system Cascade subunit CasE